MGITQQCRQNTSHQVATSHSLAHGNCLASARNEFPAHTTGRTLQVLLLLLQ